jgi:hypothetical protein
VHFVDSYYIGSINVKSIVSLQSDQQIHILEQNYLKVLISKFLNIPLSGSAELYKTIIQPFCHSQYVELSQVLQCMSIETDMCTVLWMINQLDALNFSNIFICLQLSTCFGHYVSIIRRDPIALTQLLHLSFHFSCVSCEQYRWCTWNKTLKKKCAQ